MISRQDRMEAAAWLARLHGEGRGPALEAGFRRWLDESDSHRAAFEMANEVWGDLASIPRSEHPIRVRFQAPGLLHRVRRPAAAMAASVVVAAAAIFVWLVQPPAIATQVGQLRELRLEDGTRATLNTDTRLKIRYDSHRRHIELLRGEALFEVAKDPARPFVVTASGREVKALGTAFMVRRELHRLAVTLIDGKVSVSGAPDVQPVVLAPGQRLTVLGDETASVDMPAIGRLTAWRNRQVSLDRSPLADAVAEMNRYSGTRIEVQGRAAALVVTGIFRAGDSGEFARAVADTYGLDLREAGDRLILSAPH